MPAVGAATFWMNSPAPVDPLRLRRVPLLAAALCFAGGDVLARHWQPTLLLVLANVILLVLALFSLRCAPRIAAVPVLALWAAAGCWCAQMQPPIPTQQSLQHYADGLSRTVRGRVVRARSLQELQPDLDSPQRLAASMGARARSLGERCRDSAPVSRPRHRIRRGHDSLSRLDAAAQRRRSRHPQRRTTHSALR